MGQAPGDLRTALLLAGAAAVVPAGNPRVVVLTDGAFANAQSEMQSIIDAAQ